VGLAASLDSALGRAGRVCAGAIPELALGI
jgi:hypothetical protein